MKPMLILFLLLSFSSDVLAKRAEQADPFQQGLTALKENRYADALEQFTTAERAHPDDPRVHNFRGIALTRLGQNADAAAEYQDAIRLDPRMEDAYRNLGFLQWTEHQLDAARDALQRAVQLSPGDSFAHYYLGRVQLETQHYSQAVQELGASGLPLPTDADFSIQVTAGYIALGRREDARKTLDHLVTLPLDNEQAVQVVSFLLAVNQNDAAVNLIQQLNKHPSAADAAWLKFDLALVFLETGAYQKAVEQAHAYAESLPQGGAQSPKSAPAWSVIGIAYAHLRQGEQSVIALHEAAALAPGDEEPWLNLTRELMELSRYSEAITAVQGGLTAIPKSYALHLRLGAALLASGRYAEAEGAFRDLVAAGDPLPTGYIGLAQVLMRTGRADEAASELADAAQKLGPNFLVTYFRGLALDRAGKTSDAMMAFQQAARLDANNSEVHLNLGKTELALGRSRDAIGELQEALRLNPGNLQANRLLSQAYRRTGDSKTAAKFAEVSADAPVGPEGDILGDFFIPHWQGPPKTSEAAAH